MQTAFATAACAHPVPCPWTPSRWCPRLGSSGVAHAEAWGTLQQNYGMSTSLVSSPSCDGKERRFYFQKLL